MLPHTRVDAVADTLHGVTVRDPYRWLENEKAPEVQAWMSAQDAAARARLARLPGRAALAQRFRELYYVESVSPPVKRGGRFFYVRTHKDREKAIVYLRPSERAAERVLLDPNGWSPDGTVSLGVWVPSWDGRKVAFTKRPNAGDEAVLHVMDVDTGAVSKTDVIEGGRYATPYWTPDSKGFYYEWVTTDPKVPSAARTGYIEIRHHRLGTDPRENPIIHPRTGNPSAFLSTYLSRDGRYLFAYVARGWSENDVYFRDLKQRDPAFRLLAKGQDALYDVRAWRGVFYVTTNEGAPHFRVFKVDPGRPERARWQEIVRDDPEATLEGVSIVGGHLVLSYLRNAASEVRIATLAGRPVRRLDLPTIGSASGIYGLQDEDDGYFAFSSYTLPQQVYQTSIKTGRVTLWAKVVLPIDPRPFVVEQVFYPSRDGTRISMFIVRRKDAKLDGQNPVLLYGYGGFNISMTPSFTASIYPWLEAGGIWVETNLRGGGEYGKAWHDAGRGHHKQNVFDDFIAAAEWLTKNRYTSPRRLAIYGGSNGGLLVGAAMVQRPELFGAVLCAVPLLDMIRFPMYGDAQTWVPEYGNPTKPDDFKALYAYSPYHHVRPEVTYPPLLMLSADHDDRVDPMHARKFVAAIQAAGRSRALLRIERHAGHGGADQVRHAIQKSADTYAFVMQALGVTPPDAPRH
jgi:prolyl oligopeptidase